MQLFKLSVGLVRFHCVNFRRLELNDLPLKKYIRFSIQSSLRHHDSKMQATPVLFFFSLDLLPGE